MNNKEYLTITDSNNIVMFSGEAFVFSHSPIIEDSFFKNYNVYISKNEPIIWEDENKKIFYKNKKDEELLLI